ncbi:MAG: HAMP domain-containing protein, partial [Acidimicrobiales bacterium]
LGLVDGTGTLVASTAEIGRLPDRPLRGSFTAFFGGQRRLAAAVDTDGGDPQGPSGPLSGAKVLALSPPPGSDGPSGLVLLFGVLIIVIMVLVVLVGWVVSGVVTGPVDDLVEAALAVSKGDLSKRVGVSGDVELATLGRAFNRMTDNLQEHVTQLEESRHRFRAAIARLGDILESTHHLDGIIDAVLEACALTLGADRAVYYERVALPARVCGRRAYPDGEVHGPELNGEGVAGAAARELGAVLYPGEHSLAVGEGEVESALAVPVVVENRLEAVLALYGRRGGGVFERDDLRTLQTLGRQAEVAIGNVYLHERTENQARTDGTTGLWNRREFELR